LGSLSTTESILILQVETSGSSHKAHHMFTETILYFTLLL